MVLRPALNLSRRHRTHGSPDEDEHGCTREKDKRCDPGFASGIELLDRQNVQDGNLVGIRWIDQDVEFRTGPVRGHPFFDLVPDACDPVAGGVQVELIWACLEFVAQAAAQRECRPDAMPGRRAVHVERASPDVGWRLDPARVDGVLPVASPQRDDQHQEAAKQHEAADQNADPANAGFTRIGGDLHLLSAWTDVVEPYQIDVLAFAVLRHLEKIDDTQETRLARQLPSDIRKTYWLDRVHLDLTLFHPVPVADFDVGPHPYSDAASDFAATNSLAKTLGEYHEESLHPAEDRSLRQGGLAGDCDRILAKGAGRVPGAAQQARTGRYFRMAGLGGITHFAQPDAGRSAEGVPVAECVRTEPSATIAHCETEWLRFQESARQVCHPIGVPLLPSERVGKRFLNPVPTTVGGISIMFKAGPRIFFGRAARSPKYALGPFNTDADVFAKSPDSGLRVTWIGHSTSLVEVDGIRLLIDPVWDERAAPVQWSGPKRFFPAPLALEDLPPIDAVLISHDHYDHLGAGTIRQLAHMEKLRKARWITTLGVENILRALGVDPTWCTALNWTEKVTIGSVIITALPARHFSGRSLFNRFETLWASFAVNGPRHRIYYGADSGEWPGFRNIGEEFGPFDLTMLEIGASNPLWADIHMGPEGAVRSFSALGGHGLLMPIHWGLFDLAFHHWTQPIESLFAVDDLRLWSPTPGIPSEVVPGQQIRSDWWR